MENFDNFIKSRQADLCLRTATILRELAQDFNIELVERELHRIVGTCGSYGLIDGSIAAANLLAQVRSKQESVIKDDLNAIAEIFALSALTE